MDRYKRYNLSPKGRYRAAKGDAKRRGIEWDISFDEWWTLWEPHWEARGRTQGSMQMCRTGDTGPYKVGNVRIDTIASNCVERNAMQDYSERQAGRRSNPHV